MKTISFILNKIEDEYDIFSITDSDAMEQRLRNRLKLYKGEWYLAPNEGIPWLQLKGKANNIDTMRKAIINELKRDPEVISIQSLDVILIDTPEKAEKYNKKIRTLIVNFSVSSPYGTVEVTV